MESSIKFDESRVSCPVCFELFDRPKSLKCGHILCSLCIDKLAARSLNNAVECVLCREVSQLSDLRRDFTMEDNVQLFKDTCHISANLDRTQLTNTDPSAPPLPDPGGEGDRRLHVAMCSVCDKQPQAFKCQQCSQLLCSACKDIHLKFENSRDHTVVEFNEVLEEQRQNLREMLQAYNEVTATCDSSKALVAQHQEKLARDAAKHSQAVMEIAQKVKERCEKICGRIDEAKQRQVEELEKMAQELDSVKVASDCGRERLQQSLESSDIVDLTSAMNELAAVSTCCDDATSLATKPASLKLVSSMPKNLDKWLSRIDVEETKEKTQPEVHPQPEGATAAVETQGAPSRKKKGAPYAAWMKKFSDSIQPFIYGTGKINQGGNRGGKQCSNDATAKKEEPTSITNPPPPSGPFYGAEGDAMGPPPGHPENLMAWLPAPYGHPPPSGHPPPPGHPPPGHHPPPPGRLFGRPRHPRGIMAARRGRRFRGGPPPPNHL